MANEVDRAVYATEARRAERAAELAGRRSAPDPVAVALEQHADAIDAAHAKADQVMPLREHAEPPAAPRRPAWDKLIWLTTGDFNYADQVSGIVDKIVKQAGVEDLLSALQARGIITRFERRDRPPGQP